MQLALIHTLLKIILQSYMNCCKAFSPAPGTIYCKSKLLYC